MGPLATKPTLAEPAENRGAATAAERPETWLLALVFLAALDAAWTRTPLLWAPTAFEHTADIRKATLAQTYVAARAAYAPPPRAAESVVLIGNSRIWLAARPGLFAAALARRLGSDPPVENLGIFGAGAGDLEMLARHLVRRPARVVVVAVGTDDLVEAPGLPVAGLPERILRIGAEPSPAVAEDLAGRLDRWGRTLWPLWRFREVSRAVLADRIRPDPSSRPFPDHLRDAGALFAIMHGEAAARVEAAYRRWREEPSLERFLEYLAVPGPGYLDLVARRTAGARLPRADSPGARAFDHLLRRLGAPPRRTIVVVMPENPILGADSLRRWHDPDRADAALALIAAATARHGATLVDARRWLPPEAFLDFDHPFPGLASFQDALATEVARVYGS